MRSSVLSLLAIGASLVSATLPSGVVTCGRHHYTVTAIVTAINAGVKDMKDGYFPDNYPHQYHDYPSEHIPLYCDSDGPWYEFPIMPNGEIYDSTPDDYHSPGADRVIFAEDGTYCAVVTHTGAKKHDGFIACEND